MHRARREHRREIRCLENPRRVHDVLEARRCRDLVIPADAAQSVRGSAYDFALLVTQRVHRADTDLVATGPDADKWLDIAQAFAGPAGGGREPRGS